MYIPQKKRVVVAYLSYPNTGPRYVNVVVVINGYLYNFTVNIMILPYICAIWCTEISLPTGGNIIYVLKKVFAHP